MHLLDSTVSLFTSGNETDYMTHHPADKRHHLSFVFDCQDVAGVGIMNYLKAKIHLLCEQLETANNDDQLSRPYDTITQCLQNIECDRGGQEGCCSFTGIILDRCEMQLYIVHLGNNKCMVYENKPLNAHQLMITRLHTTKDVKTRRLCEANGFPIIKEPYAPHTLYGSEITRIFGESGRSTLIDRARRFLGTMPDIDVFDLSPYRNRRSELHCLLSTAALFENMSTESILRSKLLRTATPSQLGHIIDSTHTEATKCSKSLTILKLYFHFEIHHC